MPMRLTGFSPLVRHQVNERSGGICERCGNNRATQHHHRRGRGMGSTRRPETNLPANALALCAPCHSVTESNRTEALKFGYAVPQHRIPQDVPVFRRGMWVMLLNDGDFIAIPEPATGGVA